MSFGRAVYLTEVYRKVASSELDVGRVIQISVWSLALSRGCGSEGYDLHNSDIIVAL